MKKRALSLLVTALLVLGLAVPALAADYTVPDHSWVGCSNECIRTESYTTSYGWDEPLYIFPAGTTFDVAFRTAEWMSLTAYDPAVAGDVTLGTNYVFYSEDESFAPQAGKVYHLVVSDTMSGQDCYVKLEGEAAQESGPYELPDNTLLQSSNPSTGSATVTDKDGESRTVYLYPAGTVFTPKSGMTNFQYAKNLTTGESQYLNQSFTLPETGAYELTAFDQGIWSF